MHKDRASGSARGGIRTFGVFIDILCAARRVARYEVHYLIHEAQFWMRTEWVTGGRLSGHRRGRGGCQARLKGVFSVVAMHAEQVLPKSENHLKEGLGIRGARERWEESG